MPASLRGSSVLTVNSDGGWLAHTVRTIRSVDVLADHLTLVSDALAADGVEHFILDAEPNRRRVVVVSRAEVDRAFTALETHLASAAPVYYRAEGRDAAAQVLGHVRVPRSLKTLRIFRVLAAADGRVLSAADLGCQLEVWDQAATDQPPGPAGEMIPAGTWIAPVPNRWVDHVQPQHREIVPAEIDGSSRPVLAALGRHVYSIPFPIDVVYTWVDGADRQWQERKAAALRAVGGRAPVNEFAANDSRFMSRDELKYSLRSLEMYAGWARHIYLVTDEQVPSWLNVDNPRITVIDHRDLFAERGTLPTFNSHAIESQLHHIPGLSEHFLYLNDDVFFGRPVEPRHFFHSNGLPIIQPSQAKLGLGTASSTDRPVMAAGKNNRDLLSATLGHQVANKFKHVPHSLRRSVLLEIEDLYSEAHAATAGSPFRSAEDIAIPSSLAHHYAYLTGRAVPGSLRYFYADIARTDTADRLSALLWRRNFDVFCLNDHDSSGVDPAAQTRMILAFLDEYFPLPSQFELP